MSLELQRLINKYFDYNLVEDGILGSKSKQAIKEVKSKMLIPFMSTTELFTKLQYYNINHSKLKKYFDTLYVDIYEFCQLNDYDELALLSQFALETNYLYSIIPNSYNLGNIKARECEEFISVKTHEYINGEKVYITDKFRKYDSYTDFLEYYDKLISKERYVKAYINKSNPFLYFKGLYEGGYATDPNYVDKMLNIYNTLYTFYIAFWKGKIK